MNKKIASEIAIGIVLILAISIGTIVWMKQKATDNQAKRDIQERQNLQAENQAQNQEVSIEQQQPVQQFTYGYTTRKDGKEFYVIDGKFSEPFNQVRSFYMKKGHYISEVTKDGKDFFIYDGRQISIPGKLISYSSDLSENGLHWGVQYDNGTSKIWIIDGVTQKAYDKGSDSYLMFDKEGNNNWYIAKEKGKKKYVSDGREEVGFDEINGNYSHDEAFDKYIYSAKDNGKSFYVINGQRTDDYDGVDVNYQVSKDGTYLIYSTREKGKVVVWVNGVKQQFPLTETWGITISPDGKHYAYPAEDGKNKIFVIDGQKTPAYDSTFDVQFSEQGERVAYKAQTDGKEFYVIDGKQEQKFDTVDYFRFTSSGQHYIYLAKRDSTFFYVVDGKLSEAYDKDGGAPTVSEEGDHWAYSARSGGKEFYVIDGTKSPLFDDVTHDFYFNKNGEKYAYSVLLKENLQQVYLNNIAEPLQYRDLSGVSFSEKGDFSYAGKRDGNYYVIYNGKETLLDGLNSDNYYNYQAFFYPLENTSISQ